MYGSCKGENLIMVIVIKDLFLFILQMRSKEMEVLIEFNGRIGLKIVLIMLEKIEYFKYK